MKKIFSIFVIVAILAAMFTGCDAKKVAVEDNGFVKEISTESILVEDIIVEDIIVEDIIVEDIIVEDIVEETVEVSSEYQAELEYNSQKNEY